MLVKVYYAIEGIPGSAECELYVQSSDEDEVSDTLVACEVYRRVPGAVEILESGAIGELRIRIISVAEMVEEA
jgi:hypothetical protein